MILNVKSRIKSYIYIMIPVVFVYVYEFEYVYVNMIHTHLNQMCRKLNIIVPSEINSFLNPHSWIITEKLNYVVSCCFSHLNLKPCLFQSNLYYNSSIISSVIIGTPSLPFLRLPKLTSPKSTGKTFFWHNNIQF